MAKDYKNPLEARVTKPEPISLTPSPSPEGEGSNGSGADFLTDLKWEEEELDESLFLNPADPYNPPEYTLELNGIPFAPLANIQFLKGQSGVGKTFTFSSLITAVLAGKWGGVSYRLGVKYPNPDVLYIDTEQSKSQTQEVQYRVYSMLGWEFGSFHKEFRILMLREIDSPTARWRKIVKAIDMLRPRVVFLDGMIDIISDFNDNEACAVLIGQALKVTSKYNISLWSVLHENPTSTEQSKKGNGKAVGHLGSYLERKATDSLTNIKELDSTHLNAIFYVQQGKVRGKDHGDWSYTIMNDDRGVAVPVWRDLGAGPVDLNTESEFDIKTRRAINRITWKVEGLRYTEFEAGLKAQGITSNRMLSDIISNAQSMGLVTKENKNYFLNDTSEAKVDTQQGMKVEEETPDRPF